MNQVNITSRSHRQHSLRRLKIGKGVLDGASVIDTTPVAARLEAFVAVHQAYTAAQAEVDSALQQVGDLSERLAGASAVVDGSVEDLLVALVADRRPRLNPFAAYGVSSPSGIKTQPVAEKVATMQGLVAALQKDSTLSAASQAAVAAAATATAALAAQLEPLGPLEAALRMARSKRDGLTPQWDAALKVLKRGARVAADDGATQLYTTLFGGSVTRKKKPKTETAADEETAEVA